MNVLIQHMIYSTVEVARQMVGDKTVHPSKGYGLLNAQGRVVLVRASARVHDIT